MHTNKLHNIASDHGFIIIKRLGHYTSKIQITSLSNNCWRFFQRNIQRHSFLKKNSFNYRIFLFFLSNMFYIKDRHRAELPCPASEQVTLSVFSPANKKKI